MAESRAVSPRQSVEGIVDDAKLVILHTCAIGWVKEATPIRVLAHELAVAGLQGFELVWVVGSMVLLSFSSVELRDVLLESTAVWSTWFGRLEAWSQTVAPDSRRAWISISGLPIHLWSEGTFCNITGLWGSYIRVDAATEEPSSFERARVLLETLFLGRIDEVVQFTIQGSVYVVVIQEAELVRVPIVEDRDVESESEMGEKPNEVSVASPQVHEPSNQVRVPSPCWCVNQLWESGDGGIAGGHVRSMDVLAGRPASDGLDRGRGGVCSAGDAAVATVGDRTKVSMDVGLNPELEDNRDSPIGLLECGESNLNVAVSLGCQACVSSSPSAVVGVAGAALAPVLAIVSAASARSTR
ncbi:hypothetical protein V6N11_010602 [Hibiscus sabdariffa]|uniref:DUF4283 domain-containing protein n=1 Tax=Hibiscus sabdariffa TaxID=183260 RepID=A0ABR2S5X8_9ROSI